MIYAKIDPITDMVLEVFSRKDPIADRLPPTAAKAKRKPYYLPVERKNFEPFDPETQTRTGPVYAVLVTKVNAVYTVRAKTAQELTNEKDAAAQGLLDDTRLRAFFRVAAEQWGMTPARLRAAVKAKM